MKTDKCKKLVCNLRNKKKYVVHIRSLKQDLHYGLKLKNVHRIIEFNQESWLKPYIDMNTDSFIMNIKTEYFYKDIANDVKKRSDTSNYECDRPLPTGKNKKVIGLMKDELGERVITESVALRPKTYSYLTDNCKEEKRLKEQRNA